MHIVFCIYVEFHLQMQILPSAVGVPHIAYDLKYILICQHAAFQLWFMIYDLYFACCSPSELPLTDREMEILNKTTNMTQSNELLTDSMDEEVAPPKPPLPSIRVAENR